MDLNEKAKIVCPYSLHSPCGSYGSIGSAVAITAFSANAAQSTEEVSASVSAGASGYINASYVNLRSGAGTNYSVITCMAKNTKFTFVDGKLYNSKWYKIKLKSNSKTGMLQRNMLP